VSQPFTIAGICERALRKIQAFPTSDDSADPVMMQEAAYWLDMAVGYLCGTRRVLFMVPDVLPIPLTANKAGPYQLKPVNVSSEVLQTLATENQQAIRANNVSINGVAFPIQAFIRKDSVGDDHKVEIIRRKQFDDIAKKDAGGTPCKVYITRTTEPFLTTYPTIREDGWTLYLRIQTFAPDLSQVGNNRVFALTEAWNMWAVAETAYQCGSGPVKWLPQDERNDMRRDALFYRTELLSFNNDEHGKVRRTAYRDF